MDNNQDALEYCVENYEDYEELKETKEKTMEQFKEFCKENGLKPSYGRVVQFYMKYGDIE